MIGLERLSADAYWAAWDNLRRALVFSYGPKRTAAILESRDPKTNADLRRWINLGGRE